MQKISHLLSLSLMSLALLFTVGCGQNDNNPQNGQTEARPFKIIQLNERDIVFQNLYPATIEGVENVEIRPKVDGFISKIYVDEGAFVKKGQLLFKIDAPQYEQAVRAARANIQVAQADVNTAEMELNKIRPLVDRNIISSFELENAELNLASKQAILAQVRTQLETAETNFSYTNITSPVNGVLGTIPYKIGSLVNSSTPMPLTTVSNISKIYAYFALNEKQILDLGVHQGQLAQLLQKQKGVQLQLANGTIYAEEGKIESVSGLINSSTGSVNARATFPNQDLSIRSGSSGSIIIPQFIENSVVIPQKATFEIQGQKFVYLVQDDQTVHAQAISVLSNNDGQHFVVESGLKVGDKIVLEGVHTLRNGEKIDPELIDFESSNQFTESDQEESIQ
ncbi:MAG TPA: efflux RND transporter periplasmic adaptor subunit [Chitinophagaceae bacterium]|nr:efflux RND transporter periplasmic adaptor subunit [Chitinophagaceae bacterium]